MELNKGCVYLLKVKLIDGLEFYKVGATINMASRFAFHRNGLKKCILLAMSIQTKNYINLEWEVKDRFKDYCVFKILGEGHPRSREQFLFNTNELISCINMIESYSDKL